MSNDLKKIIGILILIVGFIAFFIAIGNNNLNFSLIFITSSLIIWVLFSLLLDFFDIKMFAGVVSFAGFLVAISVFFLFGIEEIPYPIGAIVFHSEGIASSLVIGLFSLFPVIILYNINIQSLKISPKNDNSKIETNDEWELATDEDLDSEEFELGQN